MRCASVCGGSRPDKNEPSSRVQRLNIGVSPRPLSLSSQGHKIILTFTIAVLYVPIFQEDEHCARNVFRLIKLWEMRKVEGGSQFSVSKSLVCGFFGRTDEQCLGITCSGRDILMVSLAGVIS